MGSLTLQLSVWERQKGLLDHQGNKASCRSTCYGSKPPCEVLWEYRRISSCYPAALALEIYSKKLTSGLSSKSGERSFHLSVQAGGNLTSLRASFLQRTRLYKQFHLWRLVWRKFECILDRFITIGLLVKILFWDIYDHDKVVKKIALCFLVSYSFRRNCIAVLI